MSFSSIEFDELCEDLTSGDNSEDSSLFDFDLDNDYQFQNGNDNNSLPLCSSFQSTGDSPSLSDIDVPHILLVKCDKKKKRSSYNLKKEVDFFQRILFATKPKIMKTDIRRSYFNMFVNIMNSMDFPLLYGFFDTYFTPSAQQLVVKHDPECGEVHQPDEENGVADIARHWCTIMNMTPDAAFVTKDTKVHLSSATTKSKIVASFSFSGTLIYDVTSIPNTEVQHTVCTAPEVGSKRKDETSAKLEMISQIQNSVQNTISHLPLRKVPEVMDGNMVMVMHTDENMCITDFKLSFEGGM